MKWKSYLAARRAKDGSREIARFFLGDPNAPKPTMRTHLGANALITWGGKLLLERRRDSGVWGLIGGGVKRGETSRQAMARETWEEIGMRIPPDRFQKLGVYDGRDRIAAFRDGSVWRMVIVVYTLVLQDPPGMRISPESKELAFFAPEEIPGLKIAVTHGDIVGDWLEKMGNGRAET